MSHPMLPLLERTPVIPAVKEPETLDLALAHDGAAVFLLCGDILNIAGLVDRVHRAGKQAVVHGDLVAGLAPKEIAVDYLRSCGADGIISTRPHIIRRGRELGMLTIGCHLSTTKGYRAMGETALSIGANTFAFFTRNPRGGKAKDLDMDDVAALRELMVQNDFGPLVAHAPYTYNPCSAKERAREFALEAMAEDLRRMEALPGNYYNFHPGAHVGQGSDVGIQMIVDTLCQVMFEGQQTTVLLETMAGKGTEVGRSFEELALIIEGVADKRPELSAKLGVCLDTCHVNDAGYDIVHDLDGVLDEFNRVVGIERLRAVHINDSKNPCGAHKDRHECIGKGYLGSEEFGGGMQVMQNIVSNGRLRTLPFILETPNELAGYAAEIKLLRSLQQ